MDNCIIGYTEEKEFFIFSKEDYELIKNYYWRFNKQGYLFTKKNGKIIKFHRFILNIENKDIFVDHINHKLNDNRRCNLRISDCSKNQMNKVLLNTNSSGVTGVGYRKSYGTWRARITVNKKNIYLGDFDKFEDAVKARKQAEEKYFGEHSYDNSLKKVGA